MGLSRAAFARASGVSESSIARLERGEEIRASTYLAVIDSLERRGDLTGIGERIALLSDVGRARVLELIRFEEKQQ